MNLSEYLSQPDDSDTPANEWMYFCDLEIKTGKLWSGDPNLPNEDDGYAATVPNGTYVIEATGMPLYGERVVSKLRVRLKTAANPTTGDELGFTGTDSATIGVCDITAFENAYKDDAGPDQVQAAIDALEGESFGSIKVPEYPDAIMPFVPTGSDGTGPVHALMSGGKCVGIELSFMGPDDA